MTPEQKVWGTTVELFTNNTSSTHYLEIEAGGYCSEHRHARKRNIFFIIDGMLQVIEYTNKGIDIHNLCPGDYHVTDREVWHKFRAATAVKCIEIYDFTYNGVDIERRSEGGIERN